MKEFSTSVRIKTPTILQTEALECGAACLAIVLGYFRSWIALDELRSACGVSRDGCKAVNIVKAGARYGLEVTSFKAEPRDLKRFQAPMILHWNFNHFVVLEGFAKGKVFLNDPASGPRTVSETELDESFTGVVLVCKPGKDFAPQGRKPSFAQAIASRLRGNSLAISFVVICGLVLMIPRLVTPFFSKVFVQDVLGGNHQEWLAILLLWMGAAALFLGVMTWLQQTYLNRLETSITLKSSSQLFWHILRLPVSFFSQRFAGDITSRLTLTSRVAEILSRDVAINFINVVMVILFGAIMLHYNSILTGTCLAFVLLDVAALYLVSRRRMDGNRRLLMEEGKLQGAIMGGLEMIETIKATGAESDLMARWTGYHAKMINIEQGLERASVWAQAVPPLLAALNMAIVLAIGSAQVLQGKLSVGELVAFSLLLAAFLAPVARLVGMGTKLQIAAGDLNRIDDVLRYPVEMGLNPVESLVISESANLTGSVEVKNISFGYNRLERPLIHGFSMSIKSGDRIAVVGHSGSGKSTLAKLVAGLLDPWEGEIRFDDRSRRELPRSVLTGSIAMVDQTPILFEGSVRDNITLWDATISMEQIRAAAEDAGIHDDIMGRPGGYDGIVEEGGRNWSGGQRQRLDIARALVCAPSLLILDEATSALDPLLELYIHERLRRRGCSCLIVAHRLSSVRDADEILVLHKGNVAERGRHEELIARDGFYRRLALLE